MHTQVAHPYLPLLKRKSQALPNALVFDKRLSDEAVRLLVVLNATDTCEDTSNPSKQDLCTLLNWPEEKLETVMKECQSAGYMRFSKHDFTFDIEGSFGKVGGR